MSRGCSQPPQKIKSPLWGDLPSQTIERAKKQIPRGLASCRRFLCDIQESFRHRLQRLRRTVVYLTIACAYAYLTDVVKRIRLRHMSPKILLRRCDRHEIYSDYVQRYRSISQPPRYTAVNKQSKKRSSDTGSEKSPADLFVEPCVLWIQDGREKTDCELPYRT